MSAKRKLWRLCGAVSKETDSRLGESPIIENGQLIVQVMAERSNRLDAVEKNSHELSDHAEAHDVIVLAINAEVSSVLYSPVNVSEPP